MTPTWYDVPDEARLKEPVYIGGTPNHPRQRLAWNTDRNRSLVKGMNKDWQGRPGFFNAYMASYFAARQWIRGIRAWVGDDAFWARAQRYATRYGSELDHDLGGAAWIGMYSGHWQGQGEPCDPQWSTNVCGDRHGPGGDVLSLKDAVESYFEDRGRTHFRRLFEKLVIPLAARQPLGQEFPVQPTAELQRATRFVRLQVMSMRAITLGDVGPDDADLYARATIGGQRFLSGEINSHDSYSFPKPQAPFAWLKAVPAGAAFGEPVTSLRVEIRTSSARSAGTDDDVYLRVGGGLRFALDKRLYDDFERGDRDTYSVPIDDAVRAGLTIGDLDRVQIEKSRDGVAGGWKLRGVKLIANGRQIYARDGIERWLEDDHRTWRAPDFRRSAPSGPALGVSIDLWDDDPLIYGSDDHGDLDPFDRRRAFALNYAPGGVVQRRTTGGSTLGGRLGDGDKASVVYRLDTLTPVAPPPPPPVVVEQPPAEKPPPPPPPPPPAPKPDLVISDMDFNTTDLYDFTVRNQGGRRGGPVLGRRPRLRDVRASPAWPPAPRRRGPTTRPVHTGTRQARADSGAQVAESDENNNTRSYTVDVCIA